MRNGLGNSGCDSAYNTSDRPALGSTKLRDQLWLLWLYSKAKFFWTSDRADLGNDSFGTHRCDSLTMDPQSRHCGILHSKQLGSHCLSHEEHHHPPPLLMFATAARALTLHTLQIIQYLAPILQFLIGQLLYHNPI